MPSSFMESGDCSFANAGSASRSELPDVPAVPNASDSSTCSTIATSELRTDYTDYPVVHSLRTRGVKETLEEQLGSGESKDTLVLRRNAADPEFHPFVMYESTALKSPAFTLSSKRRRFRAICMRLSFKNGVGTTQGRPPHTT